MKRSELKRMGSVLVFFALALSLWSSRTVRAFTMINQNLAEVTRNTFQNRNPQEDNKPDGDVVLMTLFRAETQNVRKVYTFMLLRYLSEEDTNLKDHLHPGDLFTVSNPRQNPYVNLVDENSGNEFIAFLGRKVSRDQQGNVSGGHYFFQSMKIAPLSLRRESDGTERQVVLNPWNGDQAGFSPALGTRAFEGQNLPLEYLEDFQQKIRREIETRKTD